MARTTTASRTPTVLFVAAGQRIFVELWTKVKVLAAEAFRINTVGSVTLPNPVAAMSVTLSEDEGVKVLCDAETVRMPEDSEAVPLGPANHLTPNTELSFMLIDDPAVNPL